MLDHQETTSESFQTFEDPSPLTSFESDFSKTALTYEHYL